MLRRERWVAAQDINVGVLFQGQSRRLLLQNALWRETADVPALTLLSNSQLGCCFLNLLHKLSIMTGLGNGCLLYLDLGLEVLL